jgi:GNAT superfamily N-acetyltransferase
VEGRIKALIQTRGLVRAEIRDIWQIDRAEVIEHVYRLVNGTLVLQDERHAPTGWSPGQSEADTPQFEDCFDRGGWFQGCFESGRLVAIVILESRFFGADADTLQLRFMHVDRRYRGRRLGSRLFKAAAYEAWRRGAACLYVSATPSQNTVDFYLRQGCRLVHAPDPVLYALEPDDIHLELRRA